MGRTTGPAFSPHPLILGHAAEQGSVCIPLLRTLGERGLIIRIGRGHLCTNLLPPTVQHRPQLGCFVRLTRTKSARAIYDELTDQANWHEVRSAMTHLGDKPVLVITTRPQPARAADDFVVGGVRWRQAQEALVGISQRSRLIHAETTEHDIQFYRPDQTIAAVSEMVLVVRTNRISPR